MKKLYLVYGNTWFGGYGEGIRGLADTVKKYIFSVFFRRVKWLRK